jgi:exodeoxyribonuclease V alpha subunit
VKLDFDKDQQAAVRLLLEADVGVITGPPGTGKTTATRAALDELDARRQSYRLCAPTGKAAKRMSEATGRPAQTIHRLLEWSKGGFLRNAGDPLTDSLVVCDESSMLDLLLTADLVDALSPQTRIAFVGDANQLPPIGPGMFFRDLIASRRVPTVELQTLHRSAAASWIYRNAPRILAGRGVEMDDCADFEWHLAPDGNAELVVQAVGDIVQKLLDDGVPEDDFQVLSPMRVRQAGCQELNKLLQPLCLKRKVLTHVQGRTREIGWGENRSLLHVGDRVIQTRNNYQLNVFNGDVGEVVSMGNGGRVTVRFGDGHTAYEDKDCSDLELAYALTVHKFQGSEVKDVIVVCSSVHSSMLTRQLIYTALTRAKRRVFLVGDAAGWKTALAKNQVLSRRTRLLERFT